MGKMIDIELSPREAKLDCSAQSVSLAFVAEKSDVLDHFSEKEIAEHFDADGLLHAIGVSAVKEWLEDNE